MRVVEEKMVNAVRNNRNMSSSNTMVTDGSVYLYGIKIAEVTPTSVSVTNCDGWRSVTTKSRLNALLMSLCGVYIRQKDYEWYYSDESEFEPRTFPRK